MIYRGCELRCIAEVRAESDNHGGWYIEARLRAERTKTKRPVTAASIKIDVSFSPRRDLSRSARNGAAFNNATDIE